MASNWVLAFMENSEVGLQAYTAAARIRVSTILFVSAVAIAFLVKLAGDMCFPAKPDWMLLAIGLSFFGAYVLAEALVTDALSGEYPQNLMHRHLLWMVEDSSQKISYVASREAMWNARSYFRGMCITVLAGLVVYLKPSLAWPVLVYVSGFGGVIGHIEAEQKLAQWASPGYQKNRYDRVANYFGLIPFLWIALVVWWLDLNGSAALGEIESLIALFAVGGTYAGALLFSYFLAFQKADFMRENES